MIHRVARFLHRRTNYAFNAARHRRDLRAAEAFFDTDRFRAIAQEHARAPNAKYLNAPHWVREAFARAFLLGLHRGRPRMILDIGTGPGYFPFVCRHFGHDAIGSDLIRDGLYNDLIAYQGIDRRRWCVKPFEPSPEFGKQFDLVTAYLTTFNGPPDARWGPKRWEFFLEDLVRRQLRPGGGIMLVLNPRSDKTFHSRELRDFFLRRGAILDRGRVEFPSLGEPRPR